MKDLKMIVQLYFAVLLKFLDDIRSQFRENAYRVALIATVSGKGPGTTKWEDFTATNRTTAVAKAQSLFDEVKRDMLKQPARPIILVANLSELTLTTKHVLFFKLKDWIIVEQFEEVIQ